MDCFSSRLEPQSHLSECMADTIYCSKPLTSDEIRLIKVSCQRSGDDACVSSTLETHTLTKLPTYAALSYCWGDPAALTHEIYLDDIVLKVTANLHAAFYLFLRQCALAGRPQSWIWVDAICINQADAQEKSAQIRNMPSIYSSAIVVFIWLGDEAESSEDAFSLVEIWAKMLPAASRLSVDTLTDFLEASPNALNKDWWVAFQKLIDRPWWNRAWTYQEVLLSKNAVLLCGGKILLWTELAKAAEIWFTLNYAGPLPCLSEPIAPALTAHQLHMIYNFSMSSLYGNTVLTMVQEKSCRDGEWLPCEAVPDEAFLATLSRFAGRASSDPRDKVYALLGVYDLKDIKVDIDYTKPVHQVYAEVVKAVYEYNRRLDILSFGLAPLFSSTRLPDLNLPSWVPDLRAALQVGAPNGLDHRHYSAAGTSIAELRMSSDHHCITVTGILVDKVTKVSPHSYTNVNQQHGDWSVFAGLETDSSYPTGIPSTEAFFLTLTAQSSSLLTRDGPGHWTRLRNGFASRTDKSSSIEGMRLVASSDAEPSEDTIDRTVAFEQDYVKRFADICRCRSFFVTEKGYFGVGPHWMEDRDEVAVVLGKSAPLLVRRHGGEFQVVDECYVCGIMEGEAMNDVEEKKRNLTFV